MARRIRTGEVLRPQRGGASHGMTSLMLTVPGGAQETGEPHMGTPGTRGISPTISRDR